MKEVAPPGWGHTKAEKEKTKPNKPKSKIGGSAHEFDKDLKSGKFKGLPGDKTMKDKRASMFKLMWSMKNKGDKPHYKPGEKGVKKSQYKEERMMSIRYTKSMTDAWHEAMTWQQAQSKDKKDQNKDPVGKKHEEETYSQRISKDVQLGNSSGVGGETVFVPLDDGVTQQEAADTWHPDPELDRKTTSMKHTARSVAHQDAQKKKPAVFQKVDSRSAAKTVQRILDRQRARKKTQEQKDLDVYDVGDVKQKKGAVAASGSGTIAKAKKAKASDVNKSIEQQMADALKEKTLSYKERQNLSKGDFALPGKGGGPEGKQGGSYPIPDESHARNALARVSQHGTPAEKEKVRAAVRRKYPGIKVSEDVEIDELTADQKKKRETSRERTHSGHKSYSQAHDADRGQKKPDRNVRKYWEKPSSMRAGPKGKLPEDIDVDEGISSRKKPKPPFWSPKPSGKPRGVLPKKVPAIKGGQKTGPTVTGVTLSNAQESTWEKNFKKQSAKRRGETNRRREAERDSPGQRVPPKTEGIVKGISVSKKMAGTTVPPKQAPASQRMDKSKKLMPAPGWKTRKAGSKAGDMTTEDLAIVKEWGDTGPLAKQDVRQHGRRDWAKSKEAERKDSDRLAKQQADREKKYQAAKKEEYDPLRSSFLGEAEWKVKLKGLPAFYVPGKSAGAVRQMLRKQLKRPQDDIESIDRAMGSDKKKDFRDRAAGRG